MSLEDEAQGDLALNEEDAENVVGGKNRVTHKPLARAKAAGGSVKVIHVAGDANPAPLVETTDPAEC